MKNSYPGVHIPYTAAAPWRSNQLELVVAGGSRLFGTVPVQGSRNASLALMAGALLVNGETVLENVPDIGDVKTMSQILQGIGVSVKRCGPGTLKIRTHRLLHYEPPYEASKTLRASALTLGPLLAKLGRARVAMPGGGQIGGSPMDLHIKGLSAMNADISVEHGYIVARAGKLRGVRTYLDFPSVGATQNIMMAACTADGTTIIENAAKEPEVVDLANFLTFAGASIRGAGTDTIRIEGVDALSPVTYSVIPDRIEAATLLGAALITGGAIRVVNVIPTHLDSVLSKFSEMGAEIQSCEDWVEVGCRRPLLARDTKTLPYPGFPTDMQPQLSAILSVADGVSVLTESVFESRFAHVDELKRMGACVRLEGRTLIIEGLPRLTGAKVKATDVRSGAALILAGLAAEGETIISGIQHVDRGYEDICGKLVSCGAQISRCERPRGAAVGEDKS